MRAESFKHPLLSLAYATNASQHVRINIPNSFQMIPVRSLVVELEQN